MNIQDTYRTFLTTSERKILKLYKKGFTPLQIANKLNTLLTSIKEKLYILEQKGIIKTN